MKYTVDGLIQSELLHLGLDVIDAALIRWFIDFRHTSRMVGKTFNGQTYYLVSYKGLLEDMPILRIKEKELFKRLEKIVEVEVLEHYRDSYFRLNKDVIARLL